MTAVRSSMIWRDMATSLAALALALALEGMYELRRLFGSSNQRPPAINWMLAISVGERLTPGMADSAEASNVTYRFESTWRISASDWLPTLTLMSELMLPAESESAEPFVLE